jgi:O-methyltransferase
VAVRHPGCDGDWYDSTLTCLTHLFPLVVDRGMVVLDDYGSFDGCNRAVHRYLADNDRPEAIRRTMRGDVAYIEKQVTDVG